MIGFTVTPASLRRQLSTIGVALAIIAAVSIPAGYLFLETSIRPLLIRGAIAAEFGPDFVAGHTHHQPAQGRD